MSGFGTATGTPPVAGAPPREARTGELRTSAAFALSLAGLGALLGLVWAWWTPTGTPGERIPAGLLASEDESFIGGDGRFAVITVAAGLVAGIVAWRLRRARGPWLAAAAGLGGVVGALVTAEVGHLVQSSSPAQPVRSERGVVYYAHLGLSVHAAGLLFLEGAIAVLVFGLCVAFSAYDDLGRPDRGRTATRAAAPYPPGPIPEWSVQPGRQPEGGWGHGDAAGPPQQRYFPPQ